MSIERLLQMTSPEVKASIEQICDEAGTSDADWKVLKAAGELLAAAKAASVCPVEIAALGDADWEYSVGVKCKSDDDANKLFDWLWERLEERGEG